MNTLPYKEGFGNAPPIGSAGMAQPYPNTQPQMGYGVNPGAPQMGHGAQPYPQPQPTSYPPGSAGYNPYSSSNPYPSGPAPMGHGVAPGAQPYPQQQYPQGPAPIGQGYYPPSPYGAPGSHGGPSASHAEHHHGGSPPRHYEPQMNYNPGAQQNELRYDRREL